MGRKNGLVERSIETANRTSRCSLEREIWTALEEIAEREAVSLATLTGLIAARKHSEVPLASALRVFSIAYFRAMNAADVLPAGGPAADLSLMAEIFARPPAVAAVPSVSPARSVRAARLP